MQHCGQGARTRWAVQRLSQVIGLGAWGGGEQGFEPIAYSQLRACNLPLTAYRLLAPVQSPVESRGPRPIS